MSRPPSVRSPSRGQAARQAPLPRVGPWQLTTLIGQGEWTNVYRARPAESSPRAAADYVVKMLKPELQDDPLAITLLQREVFVCNQVRHVHLASVLASSVFKPPHYVVAPFVAGATVRQALSHAGRLDTPYSLWLARQTAEALQALHDSGWRHADVKPDNLFVAHNGHVTLLDLGLAESICGDARSGALRGSPAYVAPELFLNESQPRGASDVYSLGVTLFEMLTGQRPFVEDDLTALAAAHLAAPLPDPRNFVPQLSPRVSRLLRRMLAKQPLRRPATDELIDWLVDLEIDTLGERFAA